MKTLLLNAVALLFVLSSCSSHKSFLHQRYTAYGHKKHAVTAEKKEGYASTRKAVVPVAEPVQVSIVPAMATEPAAAVHNSELLTASAAHSAVKTSNKAAAPVLVKNTSFKPLSTLTKTGASVNKLVKEKHQKRGLLFGVIDALLSIILIVVFVAVIVFVIVILI